MSTVSNGICTAAARPLRQHVWRPHRGVPVGAARWHPTVLKCAAETRITDGTASATAATSSSAAAPPAAAPPPAAPSKADSLPPERLKQLRRTGLELKDVIKMGRRGPAEGLAKQISQRWNTSEVARLHCHGKHAANMKLLVQQLEEVTGGIVVHRAGGTVLLYRGDSWQPQQQAEHATAAQPGQQEQLQEQPDGST